MLRNYVKIAFRNLCKHKGYTFINILGLALGIACCLLIMMLVQHEFSYDRFHENVDRIFRVVIEETARDGEISYHDLIAPPVAPAMDRAFAGIEASTRLIGGGLHVQRGDASFEEQVYMVDSTFFSIFSFPLMAGREETALDDVQDIVITERTARKFFGADRRAGELVGEQITIKQGAGTFEFIVSGIAADPPANSSFQFDVLISIDNYNFQGSGRLFLGGNDWGGKNTHYILLKPGQHAGTLQAALPNFTKVAFADRIASRRGAEYIAEGDDAFRLILQPLSDLHLNPEIGARYEQSPHNPTYSYVLMGIGLLVLLIACINFITLSLGRSASRAREVGMRKVLGAGRVQLMKQFWGEALMLTLVGLAIGLLIVRLVLPEFNAMAGQELTMLGSTGWAAVLGLAAVIGLVAVAAGAYPAAILSAFRPADVLKGDVVMRKDTFSRVLVVVQYCISVGLIFSTIVMYRQLDYMLNKDIGYDDDQVLVLHTPGLNTVQENGILGVVRNEAASNPNVTDVLKVGYSFTRSYDRTSWQDANGRTIDAHMLGIDYDFVEVMGMEMAAGRDFDSRFPSDSTQSVLVNEAFVREYGIQNPVGHRLNGPGFFGDVNPTIVGVVKDFNFRSLHEEVEPAVLNMHPDYYHGMSHILLKIRPTDRQETIAFVERVWKSTFPDRPFHFSFLDDDIAAQYVAEQRWSRILTYSSLLAILIACMGLFGLATLSVARRTKEIGIRKILGSSVPAVAALVAREFAMLVGVATVIAWPLAYLGMRQWLESFTYRTRVDWWIFVLAGLVALLIAMATIGYHSIRAATMNPVRSLRYE
ncbi:MAG: ABC transporter permease [Rhodothermales bacterium]